jgi:hypothetical protein
LNEEYSARLFFLISELEYQSNKNNDSEVIKKVTELKTIFDNRKKELKKDGK